MGPYRTMGRELVRGEETKNQSTVVCFLLGSTPRTWKGHAHSLSVYRMDECDLRA